MHRCLQGPCVGRGLGTHDTLHPAPPRRVRITFRTTAEYGQNGRGCWSRFAMVPQVALRCIASGRVDGETGHVRGFTCCVLLPCSLYAGAHLTICQLVLEAKRRSRTLHVSSVHVRAVCIE